MCLRGSECCLAGAFRNFQTTQPFNLIGERRTDPFTEQIEDIFRAKLEADPDLKDYKIDLGTDNAGGLEIWVNDTKYTNVNDLPDNRLKTAFRESVVKWNK